MSHAQNVKQFPVDIVSQLTLHMEKQEALCDALEEVADTLPEKIDTQRCLRLAMSVIPLVHAAHRFEEDVLFNALKQTQSNDDQIKPVLERLHGEHLEDESFAEEVAECLREIALGTQSNFEKAGYLMRGFFEGLRRHIAFERDHLVPMLTATGSATL